MSFINLFQMNKTQSNQSSSSSSSSSAMPQSCPPNEEKKSRPRPSPLPELMNHISKLDLSQSDYSNILEGITTNLKLILKLLQELKDSWKPSDGGNPHHLAKIVTILDDSRSRIELLCSPHSGRRPHSDVLSPRSPKPRSSPASSDEYQKLRRELSVSLTARKSLENMFSSLGREKEMITNELARRVQELSCLDELVNDLKAVNGTLTEKLFKSLDKYNKAKEDNERLTEELEKALDKLAKAGMQP